MKVLSCSLQNFASYESLEFNFNDQGLCLIEGPTGSGKSTLCDAIPWVLFGRTAKGGTVNEVLSWPGDKLTSAELLLSTGETIYRSRGPKAGDNDCLILSLKGDPIRGKDLQDTQKLINNLLGFDYDLYLSAAYFHEFSQTAQFFTTTAKNRRAICEQIVDLSLAKRLQLATSESKKIISKEIDKIDNKIITLTSNIAQLNRLQVSENNKAATWEADKLSKKHTYESFYDRFEGARKKVISNKCNSCGTVLAKPKETYNDSVNPYLDKLAELETSINPHSGTIKDFTDEITLLNLDLEGQDLLYKELAINLCDCETLETVIQDFRAAIVKNTITYLENQTNEFLTNHFDAEIRVEFDIVECDKLEVNITKDGNSCSYTQLSKGQRQLLKLCFGISVMKAVSNHHGIKFEQLWFDEALDGMDDNIKLKAFSLFQILETEYESVFVVEHSSAIKSCFNNKITVELVNGASEIAKST